MAGHVFPSRDGSNAGDSTTHAIDHSALRRAFNRTAVVIIALIVAVAMGATSGLTAPVALAEDIKAVTSEDVRSGTVNLSATVMVDGQQVHRDFPNASEVQNVVPETDYTMSVDVMLNDDSVTNGKPNEHNQFNLNWDYPLPMKYADVTDHSLHVEMDGIQRVGTMQVVEGPNDQAVLRVKFDPSYAQKKNKDFFFKYDIKAKWEKKGETDSKTEKWEFPGPTQDIEITWGNLEISGGKNCYYASEVPAKDGYLGMKCDVTFKIPEDMTNFHFEDVYDDGVEISYETLRVENSKGQTMELKHSGNENKFTLDMDRILEGDYKISYQQYIKVAGATVNGDNKYENRRNTAKAKSDDHQEQEWTYTPHHQGGGDSGEASIQIRKIAPNALDSDGNIAWEVRVNTNDNKVDMSSQYKFRDELQAGSDGQPTQDYTGKAVVYRVNDGVETKVDEFDLPKDNTQSFEYIFGGKDETKGKYEFVIRYKTKPRENKFNFNNTGKAYECPPGQDCQEKTNNGAGFEIKVEQQRMLNKHAGENYKADKTMDGNAYVVPWTIEFDPNAGGNTAPVTDLELYEDWVNGRSDGNTLHMWYSKDYLNLKVEEACESGDGCVDGWKNVSNQYAAYQRDDKDGQKVELPGGTTFPKDAFNDGYDLHGGMPAFKLVHTGSNVFDKKLRISYNTLFDGTGDSYMNYAKFRYKVAGQEQNDTVNGYWAWKGDNEIGKTMNSDLVGDADGRWNDNATWVASSDQCPNGCYVSHWTVWGNGKKPWWSTVNETKDGQKYYVDQAWLNGIADLTEVETITVEDALPQGWHIDVTKDVTGYFVTKPDLDTSRGDIPATDSQDGSDWWKADDRFYDKEYGFKDKREYFKLNAEQWSEKNGSATFTVKNDGNTFNSWKVDDQGKWPGSASGDKIDKQSNAIVVLEFDTYICAEEAEKQGLTIGGSMTFTNRADMKFNGESIVPGGTSGTTTVTNGGRDILKKDRDTWQVTTENGYTSAIDTPDNLKKQNMLVYRIEIDTSKVNFLDSAGNIELCDELDNPNAEYIGGFGLYYPDENQSNHVIPITEGLDVKVTNNAETGCQGLSITLPASAAFDSNNNKRKLILTYVVRLKGVVGDYVRVTNKISMSQNVFTQTQTGENITKVQAGMGASSAGYAKLTKYDTSFTNPTALAGATFSVCKVDTNKNASMTQAPSCDGQSQDITTGTDGTVEFTATQKPAKKEDVKSTMLYGMAEGVLYVAVEKTAPAGYALDPLPHYFVLMPESGEISNEVKNYVSTNKLVAETNGQITVRDERITSLSWDKLDFSKATFDETSGKITGLGANNSARLAGASWMVQQEQCLTGNDGPVGDLPCTFYVRDNGQASSGGSSTWVKDDNSTDGVISISGVRVNHEYLVTETQAPEGYEKSSITYVFKIEENGSVKLSGTWNAEEKTVTEINDLAAWKEQDAGQETSGLWAIGNQPMVVLPEAGGGTINSLVLTGLALVAGTLMFGMWYVNSESRGSAHGRRARV